MKEMQELILQVEPLVVDAEVQLRDCDRLDGLEGKEVDFTTGYDGLEQVNRAALYENIHRLHGRCVSGEWFALYESTKFL